MQERTVNGHIIACWRTLPGGKEEAYIDGHGWCWYSRKLSAILIDGVWETY